MLGVVFVHKYSQIATNELQLHSFRHIIHNSCTTGSKSEIIYLEVYLIDYE